MLAALAAVTGELVDDQDAQVVIITGSGTEFFSSGILSPAIRREPAKDEIVRLVLQTNRLYDAIEGLPQIVIAALNGEARAGAAELCLACDIRLAAGNASYKVSGQYYSIVPPSRT